MSTSLFRPLEWFFGIGPDDFWIIKPDDRYLDDPTTSQIYWVLLALGLIWAVKENWNSVVKHAQNNNYLILFGILLVFLLNYQIFKVAIHLLLLLVDHVNWTQWTPDNP